MSNCSKCLKQIKPTEQKLCSKCNKAYHYQCLGIPQENFNKESKAYKVAWKCPECKPADKKGDCSITPFQEEDLLEAFNLLDFTGEGKIKGCDFRVAVKALGYEPTKEELQHMVDAVDKGGTDRLSFENFQTAIMRKIMSLDSDGDIMKSFRLFDTNDSGQISFENIKEVSNILGSYLTDEEIDEMIDDADKDLDGFISVDEFMKMIKTSVHIVTP